MGAPEEEGGGDGLGDAGLIAGVSGGDRGEGSELDEDGRAGEAIERANAGAADVDGDAGAGDGGGELRGEAVALREEGGLGDVPGGERRSGLGRLRGGESGGDEMDAGAGRGGMEDDAGDGMDVIGKAGAEVRGQ